MKCCAISSFAKEKKNQKLRHNITEADVWKSFAKNQEIKIRMVVPCWFAKIHSRYNIICIHKNMMHFHENFGAHRMQLCNGKIQLQHKIDIYVIKIVPFLPWLFTSVCRLCTLNRTNCAHNWNSQWEWEFEWREKRKKKQRNKSFIDIRHCNCLISAPIYMHHRHNLRRRKNVNRRIYHWRFFSSLSHYGLLLETFFYTQQLQCRSVGTAALSCLHVKLLHWIP